MELKKNEKENNFILIIATIVIAILFAIPSIIYYIKFQSILPFDGGWTGLVKMSLNWNKQIGLIAFLIIFILYTLYYFLIIKKEKQIFKNKKQLFIFITIISIIFTIVIPYSCRDVFAYIANGWSNAKYHENPYYMSVGEVQEKYQVSDEMFEKVATVWKYERLTYGPLSNIIGTSLTYMSFGNIDVALFLFKLFNLIIHLGCCALIMKITDKKAFVLLYGLNPIILLHGLVEVHNDLWMAFFIILAIYFALKKNKLFLTTICIALATAIKYVAVLILPFLLIYILREKTIKQRIFGLIKAGIVYVIVLLICYLPYLRDLQVLYGILLQQRKIP